MTFKKSLGIGLVGFLILGLLVAVYGIRNMTADVTGQYFMARQGEDLGFVEKTAFFDNGNLMHYLEGPAHGPALVLLHGQQVSGYDYAPVLSALSKDFHVFVVDYYGHGESSKHPETYTGVRISQDLVRFIEGKVGQPVILAGHSSGALLAASVASMAPDLVAGLVLEDGPFFSTEPGRAESTYAWLSFKDMYDYLQQDQVDSFMVYSLDHDYMQRFFEEGEQNAWGPLVQDPALRYLAKHPGQIPKIWYYPPELGINSLYPLMGNIQDGNGAYDLRFGVGFYDFSWFEGFDQARILRSIQAPTLVLHVAAHPQTAPSYYDDQGILLSAMDQDDAQRVVDLIPRAKYIGGFASDHNIHRDLPKDYVQTLLDFKAQLQLGEEAP